MKSSKLSLLLVVFLPAVSLAGIGCAPVFADLQSAKLVGRNHQEFTASATRVSFSSNDPQDDGLGQTELGIQFAAGVNERVDVRARYVPVEGVHVVAFGPKVGVVRDRIALSVPLGLALNSENSLQAPVPVVVVAPAGDSQAPAPLRTPDTMSLSGPRIGVTFMSDGVVGKLLEHDIEVGSFVSQFGWQKERRFLSSENGATAVTEWILLVGGIDQGVFLPSLSWLVGFRTAKGIEFAVGPNLTPVGSAIAAAAGVTLRVGNLNVPVNLAVVPSKSGVRVSLLAGFNARR